LKIASPPVARVRPAQAGRTNSANRETETSRGFAASNARETGKRRKCGAIWRIFAESAISFALPSPPQPAYPDGSGMAVCAGTGGSFSFFDSAETT